MAGLIPFTRILGESTMAIFPNQVAYRGFAHIVSFTAFLGDDGVCRTGQDDGRVEILLREDTAASSVRR